jgi:hypothetical protein
LRPFRSEVELRVFRATTNLAAVSDYGNGRKYFKRSAINPSASPIAGDE